jgi:hypothetical protein
MNDDETHNLTNSKLHLKIKGGTKREDKPPTKGQHSKSQINRWNPKIKQHGLIKRDFDSKK